MARALPQELARGPIVHEGEWWGERLIQTVKATTKQRCTSKPEVTLVNQLLLAGAVAAMKARHPDKVKTFDDMVPEYRCAPMRGSGLDSGDADTGCTLVGSPVAYPTQAQLDATEAALDKSLDVYSEHLPAWVHERRHALRAFIFQRCNSGQEDFHAAIYERAQVRVSYFCLAHFAGEDPCVARVSYFVAFIDGVHNSIEGAGGVAVRFAVCDLWRVAPTVDHLGVRYRVRAQRAPTLRAFPVMIESLQKVVFNDAAGAGGDGVRDGHWTFVPYSSRFSYRLPCADV